MRVDASISVDRTHCATLFRCTSLASLAERAERMAALLLCIGVRAQTGCGVPRSLPYSRGHLLRESQVAGDGEPTPMLVVAWLARAHVAVNATMVGEGADRVIEIALTNAAEAFVACTRSRSCCAAPSCRAPAPAAARSRTRRAYRTRAASASIASATSTRRCRFTRRSGSPTSCRCWSATRRA